MRCLQMRDIPTVIVQHTTPHVYRCTKHYDLPVQGNVSFTERGIEFYVHRNFPCRMAQKDLHRKEELVKMCKELPSYISKLWKQSSTTGE